MTTFQSIADLLASQVIELPSWAFGNSGTRFKVFGSQGTPRTVEEKIADAATVHRFTGLAPLVRPLIGGIGAILMLHRVTATPLSSHFV